MPSHAVKRLLLAWLAALALAAPQAAAQVYTTTPLYSNPVNPKAVQASASATLASGANYATNGRPAEAGTGRFKIDSWTAGMPFSSAPPDFNFGDIITPPPLVNSSLAPTVVTTNGAFYMTSRKQLVASQAGSCTVTWPLTDGTTKTITYNIGALPTTSASRLFWTDNYTPGGVNTNSTSVPDNSDYAVSLAHVYAKIHYNSVIPDFDTADSQDTQTGRTARSADAIANLGLPAIWIDGNNLLRARYQSGYFIVEYFDTPSFDNSAGFEIVYVGPARVYQSSLVLGDRLLPSEGADVAATLQASTSKASGYVVQWTASGSHFANYIYATSVNSNADQPSGDASKTQLLWQRTGNLSIVWPYEVHWYAITWPGDQSANLYVFDPTNPSGGPVISVPTNYSASVVWSEKTGSILNANSGASTIAPVGEGRALIQYQNNTDVWFIPVRVVARTNGAYISNQEVYWPIGTPLQPVANEPRLQFDGVSNYLGLSSDLQPGFTTELWIKPAAVTNNQTLVAFLDYPQQATVQAVLLLTNGFLQLRVLTSGASTTSVVTSTNSISAGIWSHVAFTKSSTGQLILFVNGVADLSMTVSTFNANPPATATYAQMAIGEGLPIAGAVVSPLSPFAGEIKEVRLWSATIDPITLQKNMTAQLTGGELNLDHLITPSWQESGTPADGIGTATFLVLDQAQGTDVSGYGSPNTGGQLPYALNQRLAFGGSNSTELPLVWNRSDNLSVEFWLLDSSASVSESLVTAVKGTTTNFSVGLSNGHLTMTVQGSGTVTGTGRILDNSSHQVAISSAAGTVSLYLDAALQGTIPLPGSGSSSIAQELVLGSGFLSKSYSNLVGELSDVRVYSAAHTQAQVNTDLTSAADFTDPSLIRWCNFDQLSPAVVSGESVYLLPDQARGYTLTYHGPASLGSSLSSIEPAEVSGGIVRSGTAYQPTIYTNESRIIPVNDVPTNSLVEVWWSSSFTAPYLQTPLQIPSEVTKYRLMDPLTAPVLVLAAQNAGGYAVPSTWNSPSIYYQNDPSQTGYNPNEEHALLIGNSVYALRWDLNQPYTSSGYVMLQYQDANRGLLSYIQPIRVVPTNSFYPNFDAQLEVGQLLQAPAPMIYLPNSPNSGPLPGEDPKNRLYQDRQNAYWAQSASSGTPDSVPTRWYYPLQPGFYWPSSLGAKSPGDPTPFGNTSNALQIHYTISWPPIVPVLALGQTLSDAMPSATGDGDLPAVTGQASVEILYDDATASGQASAVILDPTTTTSAPLASLNGISTATDVQQGKTYFTLLPPHMRDRVFWDPIAQQLTLTGEIVRPITGFPYVLPAWLGTPGSNTNTDFYALSALSSAPAWQTAIGALREQANIIPDAETPFTDLVLTPTGVAGGHVTLGVNTRQSLNNTGDPVLLYPIYVDPTVLYPGSVIVIYSDNKFDQYTSLRHSGDFGGDLSKYQFDWRYSAPDNGQVPTSDPGTWIQYMPVTTGLDRIIFGGPGILTLKDEYFAVRWRCSSSGAPNTNWSSWTSPVLVQSWLTRALDGINPFDQRVASLANSQLDLTTSILAQAGKRFVGAVPLNRDNAVNYGLIETYETLLQQARNLSIDAGYSDVDVNNSLLDAASKLNELYTMLADEALSDAKDPTIAWGNRDLNQEFFGFRASSLFAFEGIVPTLLEEELGLLRGMDDTSSTPVTVYPVYNRLYWNFTAGINSGEPAYALNYGIPSVVSNENGSITAADAAKLYPQGHGDAYGHYLTALMEYYRLLENTNFTWYPRAEVTTIGGVNVTFDYEDERKMASTALSLARTAEEIIDRTFRRDYKLDPAKRLPLYLDSNTNRAWSATEWCDRASQGALYNWVVLNSMLPSPTPIDTPQTISRATVPELSQIAGEVSTIQDKQDDLDRGDSPMGVAANVVPFDLDPQLVDQGQSHFDQIYARAVNAIQAAYAVFQQASEAAADLRRQDVSLESFRYQVAQRENEFNAKLVDLYGTPYPDDIGPTGAFATGYAGPDLYHYNYIDRDLFSPSDAGAVTNVSFYSQYSITGANLDTLTAIGTNVSYAINSDGIPLLPPSWNSQRAIYGKIQGALGDYIRAWISLRSAIAHQTDHKQQLQARLQRLQDHNAFSTYYGNIDSNLSSEQNTVNLLKEGLDATISTLDTADSEIQGAYQASKDPIPQSFIAGLADGGDLSFPARIGLAITKLIGDETIGAAKDAANFASYAAGKLSDQLGNEIADNAANLASAEDQSQTVMETTMLLSTLNADSDSIYGAAVALRQAWQNYTTLVAQGNQAQTDLLVFRQQNAARIQEARYADVVFRTFKNEDLEEYLTAFQQASRYVFAAARVYDYETGLLDPAIVSGQDGDFMGDTMKATQLGDIVNGQPEPGSTGDSALASILAKMQANWTVLKGRFGINNPTRETHKISLRQELFRIGHSSDPTAEADNVSIWQNKLYTYRVPDIRQVPEFKNFCEVYSPMGTSEPAVVITFSTEISAGKNIFGLPLSGGDTVFDSAHFTTKIRGAAVSLVNYDQSVGSTLTKSPRVYLFPAGIDRQRTPIDGGATIRNWQVIDQVWPIPYPSAAGNVNLPLQSIGTDNIHTIRRFPPMRAYDDDELTAAGTINYDSRLIARSAWNTEWVLIIPGSMLSSSPDAALDSLIEGITDINLLLETYSYSGN